MPARACTGREAWPQLKALAELLAAPVTTSLGGKTQLQRGPSARRSARAASPSRKPVRHFLDKADVIFGVGCSFTETNFGVQHAEGPKIIHATLDPMHLNKDRAGAISG